MRDIKIKDSAMAIFFSGSIATIFQMIFSWSLYLMGIINQNPSILHTRLLVNKMKYTNSVLILGLISNFVTGIFFMITVWIVLKVSGTDYAIYKGGFMGFICAMMQFLFFARLFTDPTEIIPSTATLWHVYIAYTIWGIIGAHLLKKYCVIKVIG